MVCDSLMDGIIKLYDLDKFYKQGEKDFDELRYSESIQMFRFNINGNLIGVLES